MRGSSSDGGWLRGLWFVTVPSWIDHIPRTLFAQRALYLIRIVTSSPDPAPLPPLPIPHRRRRPTRRTAHTREAIVAAAIDVLDEAGTRGISMRRVAERLGTGAASLYAHVSGREELLELVFDELAGQVRLPTPDPLRWREQIHEIFSDWRAILLRPSAARSYPQAEHRVGPRA